MEYLHEWPTEPTDETMMYIDRKRNWQVDKQQYQIDPKQEILIEETTHILDAKIYFRGEYLICEIGEMVHFWEATTGNKSNNYNFFQQAYELMQPTESGAWKTVNRLISFRHAIRQTEVNLCGYVDSFLRGYKLTEKRYNLFMNLARQQDLQHHGSNTF